MFKEMAAVMTDKEVERCMSILVEGSIILNIKRDIIQNAIDVTFRVIGDVCQKEYSARSCDTRGRFLSALDRYIRIPYPNPSIIRRVG